MGKSFAFISAGTASQGTHFHKQWNNEGDLLESASRRGSLSARVAEVSQQTVCTWGKGWQKNVRAVGCSSCLSLCACCGTGITHMGAQHVTNTYANHCTMGEGGVG